MSKANKVRFGVMGAAIANVESVMMKPQDHDFNGQNAVSWAILTKDGKLIKATTYNGNLGAKFNLGDHNTQTLPAVDSKEYRRALKGYSAVPLTQCPIVESGEQSTSTTTSSTSVEGTAIQHDGQPVDTTPASSEVQESAPQTEAPSTPTPSKKNRR